MGVMEKTPYEAPKIPGEPKDPWLTFRLLVNLIFVLYLVFAFIALLLPASS
jgi:hypothetical protein